MHPQDWMDDLFGSTSRVRILRLLARHPGRTWTEREIAREIGMSPNTVNRAIAQLEDSWMLRTERIGPSRAVRFRTDLVLSATLQNLFQEERHVLDAMKQAITAQVPEGTACYLFGSTARGTAHQESDVDILVVAPNQHEASETAHRVDNAARRVAPSRFTSLALDAATFRQRANLPVYQAVLREGIPLSRTRLEDFL